MLSEHEPGEIERLRAENRALDEQVKLLVQTEQRLYRSQGEVDAQLERLRQLEAFALGTTSAEPLDVVVRRAAGVLVETFDLDWGGAIALGEAADAVLLTPPPDGGGAPAPLALPEPAAAWLLGLPQPECLDLQGPAAPGPALALLRGLAPEAAGRVAAEGGVLVVAPVKDLGRGRRGALVAFAAGRRARPGDAPDSAERRRPFLLLLARHLEHAIHDSELTESLREHRDRLARSLETLEATQQQLLRSQKMEAIGRLAGGVAHDFNNLLTVILGYAGALAASPSMGPLQQENVRRVTEAARKAADITSQLLALGRRQIRRLEDLDLSSHAARTADLLARLVGEDVTVELELDRALPPIRADRAQVEQALLNLVVNAREAMPRGGRLRIVTRRATPADAARCGDGVDPGRFAALEVRDDGVGMDAATRARVFEPFFGTPEGGDGGGLGLAVVYGVVTQSDGHVYVDSEPGRGTCFTLLLPYAVAVRAIAPGADGRAAEPGGEAAPATVLLVEDELALREVLGQALRRAGFTVREAADGVEALQALRRLRHAPDLVLADVRMPRLGGVELARELARLHPEMPVALMSGYSQESPVEAGRPGPAFLAKPFTPQQLVAFVGARLVARGEAAPPDRRAA